MFDKDRIADYQNMVAALRNAGIRAELYLGSGKFGPQMKYADRRNAPCVVIQGSDEKAKGEVTIKDLIVGAELAKLEKGRDEHLQKQAEAQRAVPEANWSKRCARCWRATGSFHVKRHSGLPRSGKSGIHTAQVSEYGFGLLASRGPGMTSSYGIFSG